MSSPSLYVRAPDEGTRIEVLDPSLQPLSLPHNAGEVKVGVRPGVYAVRFRRGLAVTEKLAFVGKGDGEVRVTLDEAEEPVFATAAPVSQASETNEAHRLAAERLSRATPHSIGTPSSDNGRLLLFVRADGGSTSRLDAGITLHSLTGKELVRADALGEANLEEGWAGLHLSLPAGAYRIRRQGHDVAFEQIVHVRHEWQTQYFAKALAGDDGMAADFTLIAVLMAYETQGFDGSRRDGRFVEAALRALREQTSIPGPMSQYMLDGKFENPLLGVLAALLQLRRNDLDVRAFRPVVQNLLWLMGPSPDVLAIGLGLMTREPALREEPGFKEAIRIPGLLGLPPYFSESWRHICDATQWDATLIPVDSVAARVSTSITQATPWFRWRFTPEAEPSAPEQDISKKVIKGGGALGAIANLALAWIGVTPDKIEEFSAGTLSRFLQSIQKSLARIDEVPELLRSPEYTDLERRITGFVYPLTDPALEALLASRKNRAEDLREAVLARGRDGRELARALQLPLGTAVLHAFGLSAKLSNAVQDLPPKVQITTFVERESQGNAELREALEALHQMPVPVRRPGKAKPLDALEYLVLRYDTSGTARASGASATKRSMPRLLTTTTGEPADARSASKTLREVQQALSAEVSARVEAGKLTLRPAKGAKLVAPVSKFRTGGLFPKVAPVPQAAKRVKRRRAKPKRGGS